jgi:hypothetical protein
MDMPKAWVSPNSTDPCSMVPDPRTTERNMNAAVHPIPKFRMMRHLRLRLIVMGIGIGIRRIVRGLVMYHAESRIPQVFSTSAAFAAFDPTGHEQGEEQDSAAWSRGQQYFSSGDLAGPATAGPLWEIPSVSGTGEVPSRFACRRLPVRTRLSPLH